MSGRSPGSNNLQYFDGCPNWETTDRTPASLFAEGWDATVEYELIDSHEQAVQRGFGGSPTVRVDGVDHSSDEDTVPDMAWSIYQTDAGPAGSPSIDQLRRAIARAETG